MRIVNRNHLGYRVAIVGLCLWPLGLAASDAPRMPVSPGVEQLLKMALALVVVLAVVLILARLTKGLRGIGGTSDSIEVIGQLALGARERLLIVRVDDKRLLLGVSAAGITRLHELNGELPVTTDNQPDFAQQLRAQTGGQSQ